MRHILTKLATIEKNTMAQKTKLSSTKSDNLNLHPRSHMGERKNN